MIYLLHVGLMLLSMTILTAFLWVTRRYDDILWWALRCLLLHSLIAVVYMVYVRHRIDGLEMRTKK